eukprot:scaffold32574_cov63-Attheya_sp.AAC.1
MLFIGTGLVVITKATLLSKVIIYLREQQRLIMISKRAALRIKVLCVIVFCRLYFLEWGKLQPFSNLLLDSSHSSLVFRSYHDLLDAAQQILLLRNLSTPEALPLSQLYAPWEVASINGICQPPNGTPTRCCLGSTSAGGGVHHTPNRCSKASYGHFPRPSSNNNSHCSVPTDRQNNCTGVGVGSGMDAIFDSLLRNNWTLAITGDSVMRQMAHGLECEWLRSGEYETVSLREETRTKRGFWRLGIAHVMEWKVGKKNNESRVDNHHQVVRIRFYAQYRPYEDMSEMEEI